MSIMILIYLIIKIILLMMLYINLILSKKMNKNREKMSPFECGFDPISINRKPFSLQFYLISILFLIFDVELCLIIPMIYSWSYLYYMIYIHSIMIFIMLMFGLYMEMNEGALKWFK